MNVRLPYFRSHSILIVLLLLGTLVLSGASYAQQRTVKGTVTTGDDPLGLPGVNVLLKGTTIGTVTDIDGNYSINVPEGNVVLVFSMIGFEKQEVEIGSRAIIDVTLSEDISSLDEVVVVGYGSETKKKLIGGVSQISQDNLESRPIPNLTQGLTGQMAGVTVIQRSGKPGSSGGAINIRGFGSFGASDSPLILIDGIPGSLDNINPSDVETVSVLKDASSAAIYGARSANGVVLVTTKMAKESITKVNYSGYVGIQKATEFPDFVNSWEYAENYNIASGSQSYSPEDIESYRSMSDLDNYPNTNFIKETFSRNGLQTGHNFSISNGGTGTKYFLSLGYLNQQGLVEENNYKRYNARLNTSSILGDKFTLTTQLYGSSEESNEPVPTASVPGANLEQLVWRAVRQPNIYLGRASNGDFGLGPVGEGTPVSWIASDSYLSRPDVKAGGNFNLSWFPISDLKISAIGGFNYTLSQQKFYQASQILSDDYQIPDSRLNQSRDISNYMTIQYLADYQKVFNQHEFQALLGYSFEKQSNDDFSGTRQDFPSNDYTSMNMGGVDVQTVNGSDYGWAIQSLFSRMKYSYLDKYLVEGVVRYDGSSRFPKNNKYALFPSFALGWRISEEDFFRNSFSFVSDLKLKGSWGVLGNQNIGNYPYQAVLNSNYNYPFGNGFSTGVALTQYKDPNITWESTENIDIGIETGFFDDMIKFNATYFSRNTYDILYRPSSSVSSVLGLSISETNTGQVRNRGWEFEIAHSHTLGEFSYNIQGNLTIINNEVVTLGLGNIALPNGMVGNGSNLFIGYPMQLYYGYKTDGVFINSDEIEQWASIEEVNPDPQPGDVRYLDINGPDGIPDGKVDAIYDRTYLGGRIPKYTYSMILGANFKGFDFSIFFQGVGGVSGRLEEVAGHAFYGDISNLQRWQMNGRFDADNPERYPDHPRFELISQNGTPNTVMSDFWILDASYLRIKNLQVGYTLPKSIVDKISVEKLRIYFSADNLYTFSSYRDGWDPEINTRGNYYPILGVSTFGVNITL